MVKIQRVRKIPSSAVEWLHDSDPWHRLGYSQRELNRIVNRGEIKLVAKEGKKIIGLALIQTGVLGGFYLSLLAVAPSARGLGVGRSLMRSCEQIVFSRSKNFYLLVSSFNRTAQRFYRQCGYERVGRLRHLLVREHDEVLFRKTIGPIR